MFGIERRRGITRAVWLVGRWAVKVPSARAHNAGWRGRVWSIVRGISANLSEADWSGYEEFTGKVAPVLWSGLGIVNVYPRCGEVAEADADYAAIGVVGPMDKKPHNLGWLDGRLVWVDYDLNWNDVPPCMCLRKPEPPEED